MTPTTPPSPARASAPSPGLATRAARAAIERRLAGLRGGTLVIEETWSGRRATFGDGTGTAVTLHVRDPRFYGDLARGGSVGAGESYARGRWTCEELPALVALLVRNREVLSGLEGGLARLAAPARRLAHALRRNTRSGSRRNIAAHYDLGNDFFALFLDETMTYSCGLFETPEATMAQASVAKLDRLCRKLDLRPHDRLLEIGCGWGSLAIHAARHFGCQVTATTISRAQHELATERVAAAGLADRVEVLLEDYRDLRGRYDKIASVEMIEAVGADHLDAFARACGERLAPDGLLALQAITIQDQEYERARRDVDFIKRHVFPGSFIPCVTAILDATTRASALRLVHMEDLGPHYVATLARWRAGLRARRDEARALGYDEVFLRAWDYYLAYCEGGFEERALGLAQMLLAGPRSRRRPILPAIGSEPASAPAVP